MSVFRFLFVTDTQQRGNAPRCRVDDFPATLERKIAEVGELARRHQVDAVLHGGDFFDHPVPAPAVAARFFRAWRRALGAIPLLVVPGNHDEVGHNPELIGRTMLGLGAALGVYELLGREPVVWAKDGLTVQLSGTPYHYDIDRRDPRLDYVPTDIRADRAIHIVHGMLGIEPAFPGEYTPVSAIWDQTGADLTLAGHNHLGWPLVERHGRLFYNPGALVRVTADPRDMQRTVKAVLIEVTRHGVDVHDLPLTSAPPADEVLAPDAASDLDDEARQRQLRAFIESVRALGQRPGENLAAFLDRVALQADVDPDVLREAKARLSRVLEQAQARGEEAAL